MSNEPNKIIYSMIGVSKYYDKKPILKDIYLSYFYGAKIGVLGLNGSGKSTLLKILAGVDTEIKGETAVSPGFTVGYFEQEPELDPEMTVREVIEEGVSEIVSALREFDEINARFAEEMSPEEMEELLEKQGKIQDKLDSLNAWDLDSNLERAMDVLGCPAPDAKVSILSGGEKRRVAMCRLLLQKPDILLLDEPTNHMDAETVAWLEAELNRYPGTVIAVTHDRYFLDNVAGWILELDRGEGIPWKGNYSSWLEQKQERLRQEEKKESHRQKTLERELEWIKMSPRGRQAKNKARINSYSSLLNEESKEKTKNLEIFIPPGPRLGNNVIDFENVTKGFDDKILFEDLSFKLPPGGIVGVIGPNGAGKTTLFKLITGEEKPDNGSITIGDTVNLAYVEQNRELLDPDKTVWEMISGGNEQLEMGGRQLNSRAYVGQFNFLAADQQKKVGVLSGGERNRVNLAMVLKEEANVILLDEPTNDLDVNTMRALEEGLVNFAGCAVVISHDRWFLDRICTHMLAFEGEGKVVYFEGNFSDYMENKRERLGKDAEIPHKIKYKKLSK